MLLLLALAPSKGLFKIPIGFLYKNGQITTLIFQCVGCYGASKFVGHNFRLFFRSFESRSSILGFLSQVCLFRRLHF